VEVHARLLYCRHVECPQRIFCERIPTFVALYARRTLRLNEALRLIGLAVGGEAGSRLAIALGMSVSPDTIIREASASPLTEVSRLAYEFVVPELKRSNLQSPKYPFLPRCRLLYFIWLTPPDIDETTVGLPSVNTIDRKVLIGICDTLVILITKLISVCPRRWVAPQPEFINKFFALLIGLELSERPRFFIRYNIDDIFGEPFRVNISRFRLRGQAVENLSRRLLCNYRNAE